VTYLTVEQAQQRFSPAQNSRPPRETHRRATLAVEKASGVRVRHRSAGLESGASGWFILDEVVGKHEFITYAVGLKRRRFSETNRSDGTIAKTYGYEIRNEKCARSSSARRPVEGQARTTTSRDVQWRDLSCRHIHRWCETTLALHDLVLK